MNATEFKARTLDMMDLVAKHNDGGWLTGGEPVRTIAEEWASMDITIDEADAYMEARCFCANAAEEMKAAGITPDMASDEAPGYGDTVGYMIANGDISTADIREIYGLEG